MHNYLNNQYHVRALKNAFSQSNYSWRMIDSSFFLDKGRTANNYN